MSLRRPSDFLRFWLHHQPPSRLLNTSGQTIEGSIWHDPALWLDWKDEIAALPQSLVFFCAHGHEISQAMAAALSAMNKGARYLAGGFSQWQTAEQPVTVIANE